MNQQMTTSTKLSQISRGWRLFDVNEKTLGRVASEIATVLMGKSKPYFVSNLDCGDFVVVINAEKIKVSGRKELLKKYFRHSGYPGGDIQESLADLRKRNKMLTRLFIFKGAEHPYADKFKK